VPNFSKGKRKDRSVEWGEGKKRETGCIIQRIITYRGTRLEEKCPTGGSREIEKTGKWGWEIVCLSSMKLRGNINNSGHYSCLRERTYQEFVLSGSELGKGKDI